MLCCGECFGDRDLSRQIISIRSRISGKCPVCGSQDQALIDAGALGDYFYSLLSAYEQDAGGQSLVGLLVADWGLFPPLRIDAYRASSLLAEVLNDGELVRQRFTPIPYRGVDNKARWETLRSELMHQNRFFPQSEIGRERLSELLAFLEMDPQDVPSTWYRARIEKEGTAYPPDSMGAPPQKAAAHGRANPAGIPYLYLGSESQTAIAEVRPHPGETVCVAEFFIPPTGLSLIDLRQPKISVSPFMVEDVVALRADLAFLERLGDELRTPITPGEAAIAYIPSQYLCEFIKRDGYDGVVYASSVSTGMNLALFFPDKATVGVVREFQVTKVDVQVQSK